MRSAPRQIQSRYRAARRGALKGRCHAMRALPVKGSERGWKQPVEALRRCQGLWSRDRIEAQSETDQRLECACPACVELLMAGFGRVKRRCIGDNLKPFGRGQGTGQPPILCADIERRIGVQAALLERVEFGLGIVAEKDVVMGK